LRRAGYKLWFESAARVVHRPSRTSFASIWSHGIQAGRGSLEVRRRYPEEFGILGGLYGWRLLIATAPLLACASSARAWVRNPDVRSHISAVPALLLSRFAWAIGVALATRDRD
jgi:hypothetical protein